MVALAKVWSDDLNNLFSDQLDQRVQYREAIFAFVGAHLAAGWTVELSTDGTNAPDATNQWTSAAILLYGNAAQPRAWIVLRSPAGWAVGAGLYHYMLVGLENVNTSTTPRTWTQRGSTIPWTGGSTTTFPTTLNSGNTQWTRNGTNFLSWAAPARARWNAWWTADGDVWFALKGDGVAAVSMLACSHSSSFYADQDGGFGQYRGKFGLTVGATISTNQITWASLQAAFLRCSLADGGIPSSTTSGFASTVSILTAWALGANDVGRVPDAPIEAYTNTGSVSADRQFGELLDVRGSPNNAPFNLLIDGDTDPFRLVNIGCLWMPCSARLL
jgi:hypothetical protein